MPDTPKPLTDADCRALGLLPINNSRERDDDMGGKYVRDVRDPDEDYGRIAIAVREGALYSKDPVWTNQRIVFGHEPFDPETNTYPWRLKVWWHAVAYNPAVPKGAARTLAPTDVLLWYVDLLPPNVLAECFNADQVPAYEAATDWRKEDTSGEGDATSAELYGDGKTDPLVDAMVRVGVDAFNSPTPAPLAPVVKAGQRVLVDGWGAPQIVHEVVVGLDGVSLFARVDDAGTVGGVRGEHWERVVAVLPQAEGA